MNVCSRYELAVQTVTGKDRLSFTIGKDNGLARQLGVWTVPVTLFIAKNGEIKRRYVGYLNQAAIKRGIDEIQE